jgi:hypothetical protein
MQESEAGPVRRENSGEAGGETPPRAWKNNRIMQIFFIKGPIATCNPDGHVVAALPLGGGVRWGGIVTWGKDMTFSPGGQEASPLPGVHV